MIERNEPSLFGFTIGDKPFNGSPNRLEKHHKILDQCDTATEGQDVPEPGRQA